MSDDQSPADSPNAMRRLILAIDTGDMNGFEQLLSQVPDVNTRDPSNWTPLQRAINAKSLPMVQRLLEAGAKPDAGPETYDEPTAVESAVRKERADILELLLRHGASVKLRGGGLAALGEACAMRRLDLVRILLDAGVEADGERASTPLMSAAARACPDIVELLLERGADVKRVDRDKRTPLWYAAAAGPYDCAPAHSVSIKPGATKEEILKAMEQPPPPSPQQLQEHENKILAVVGMLLEAGSDPNVQDSTGKPPLAVAKTTSVAKLLVERGARTDLRDKSKLGVYQWFALKGIRPESVGLPATPPPEPAASAKRPARKRSAK